MSGWARRLLTRLVPWYDVTAEEREDRRIAAIVQQSRRDRELVRDRLTSLRVSQREAGRRLSR